MSEKVSIQEIGKSRNFSGVETIETETPEGESCFWVPESERELETEYVIKNGVYRPQKYGYSDIHVNVFDLTTDLDGFNWKIDIGDIDVPDVSMPDISLPDFDIDLSLDPSTGLPNIEFDIHIITVDDDEIKVVLPGGEEIIIHGPSLTEPVVILNAIEISYDPSTGEWTIKAIVECTVGDTTYKPGDVIKTWPGTEKVDFYIQAGIALPDLSETIDLDAGFDVSLDVGDTGISIDDMSLDLIGVDLNGDDIKVDIDLGDMSIDVESCPESIYILSRPASLVYTDGDTIDFTGLVIAALDKDGMDWPDPSTFTPISNNEIFTPTITADINNAIAEQAIINGDVPACIILTGFAAGDGPKIFGYNTSASIEVWNGDLGQIQGSSAYVNQDSNGVYYYKPSVPQASVRAVYRYAEGPWAGSFAGWNPPGTFNTIPAPVSSKPISGEEDIDSVDSKGATVPVTVQWTSPCMETLETTFDITVYPKQDHGGSHHSGKF